MGQNDFIYNLIHGDFANTFKKIYYKKGKRKRDT